MARHLKKSHVKVLFSRHENFPCVVVEALCCGLPVVAADVAGVKEAINETNGILVTSEDEEQLLKALIQVREQFESYNTEAISNEAIEKYNYKVIGRQIFNLYSGDLRN